LTDSSVSRSHAAT